MDTRDPAAVADLFDRAAEALRRSPLRRGCAIRLPRRGRLLATGDLHDNPMHLRKILRLARLEQSCDHHVVLHEMIHSEKLVNGMDFSHRILVKVAALSLEFPGQVHPLLANHELAQLTGKGISKGAGNSVELFNDGLEFAFGEEFQLVLEAIQRFIAAMPLALVSESGVLCAHSLPAPHMLSKFDLDVLERDLVPSDYAAPTGAAHLMVWGRGHTAQQIEEISQRWGVKLFCLGHEHADTGVEVKWPKLLVLNSDHERAAALRIDLTEPAPSAEEAFLSAVPLSAVS